LPKAGETDLMRLAGWKSRATLQRYGASAGEDDVAHKYGNGFQLDRR
jgi:hypothetical protein